MTRSYLPPHYSTVGIQMMGHMFEQQVRIAQALGAAAIASNPLLARPVATAESRRADRPDEISPEGRAPVRRANVPSLPPQPKMAARTHATPV
jgi:hypothetical protein